MEIQQIYTKCLSQASYYIESEGTAIIIDPIRDIDNYLEIAKQRKAKIKYVLLTHFHADFVSGHLDIASKTGADIVFGPEAKPNYPAIIANDNDKLKFGKCEIEVLHTPGHTIESTCFLLYDKNKKPHALFSGDTLFVGDTGRPDLLSGNLDAESLATMLYNSIQTKIKTLPDDVIVYPGHGAGSACGKNLGKETTSTIGKQKKTNYALKLNKEDFIAAVTTHQPLAPAYFFKDAQINSKGYDSIDTVIKRGLKPLSVSEFKNAMNEGAIIVDARVGPIFGKYHIKGSINIGLEGQFAIWAGTLLDFNKPVILITHPEDEREAVVRLTRIGYDNVLGVLDGGLTSWINVGGKTDDIKTVSIQDLKSSKFGSMYELIDVRRTAEVQNESLPGSINIPLELLNKRMNELKKDKRYAVYCAGGYRSMIAASILKHNGFEHILDIEGGIAQIKKTSPELLVIA